MGSSILVWIPENIETDYIDSRYGDLFHPW